MKTKNDVIHSDMSVVDQPVTAIRMMGIVSLIVLAIIYFGMYQWKWVACQSCNYQQIPYVLAIIALVFSYMNPPMQPRNWLWLLLIGFIFGSALAASQQMKQNGWYIMDENCGINPHKIETPSMHVPTKEEIRDTADTIREHVMHPKDTAHEAADSVRETAENIRERVTQPEKPQCRIVAPFLGISLAAWNTMISAVFSILSALTLYRTRTTNLI
jgi:disulfide bond formation protein DsbB